MEDFEAAGEKEYWLHRRRMLDTNQDLEESGSEERIVEAVA